jgi:hypothetical protein
MGVIGSYYHYKVHSLCIGQLAFLFDHFFVGRIYSALREEKVFTGLARIFGVAAEGAADEFDEAIHVGRDAVDRADEGVAAAANHSHSKLSSHMTLGFNSKFMPWLFNLTPNICGCIDFCFTYEVFHICLRAGARETGSAHFLLKISAIAGFSKGNY